jgi:hypothetical protein
VSPAAPHGGRVPETVPPVVLSEGRGGGPVAAFRRSATARRWLVLGSGLLLAAGLGWFIARPSGHPTGTIAQVQAAAPNQDEVAAVVQLLQAHARALTSHDRASWIAGLDRSAAADTYRNTETAVFDNVAALPLSTWRYVLTAPVTDADVLQPAAARLGGRVVIVHVQLQYALARVDPRPTSKDEWITAVHRATGWRLAGDSDAQAAGGPSWHGPWDFGPLVTSAGPHTLVVAHPDRRAELATFQRLVEQSVPVVTGVWGPAWNSRVAVLIPDSDQEFQAVTGDGNDIRDIAAVAVADAVDPAADPTVAVQGARIVLNPANLSRLDAAGRRLVVQHELTHIASRAVTSDQMPTWLIEGFADYVGNLDSGRPVPVAAQELAAEVRRGSTPAALPTGQDFDGDSSRLPQAYEESWLACRLIAARVGQHGLVDFYRTVAAGTLSDPAGATARAFGSLLHLSVAQFTRAWQAYLVNQLG